MNNVYDNLVIYNGYPISLVAAVTFHILVLAALLYFQANSKPDVLNLVQPTVITALFIDENPQLTNERLMERQRLERIENQRIARDQDRRRQEQEAEQQAQTERQRQQQQQLQRERDAAAMLERQQAERLLAEQLQQAREQERQSRETEQQRQRDLAEADSRRQQRERLRQQEAAQASAAQAARTEMQLVQSATGLIQQLVQENWSRPPSARNGMQAIIQIRMVPTGELVDVTITQSSGDPAFDRSAETAVYRAAPFSELLDLPATVFNANFRVLSLIFEPEDLLN
jgi:colicin import membrane protein